ncbi:T9SS type A sorting domain-containing protein [Gillisia sp. JM1]|uniref:Ig-like domain-containing protein n=1 Tax=Gillisia sp. JM1 TaxID=1283286 RepID=UPI00047B1A9D|nr:T9SS type A sorting domain-containing protein [Gillisia sp. JM1]
MGKKLLFLVFLTIAYLLPTSVLAQCPTSVSISASPGTTICSGTSVTFAAAPAGGTNLSYEWFIGSTSSQSGTSSTFTSTTLNNSDKIKVKVTSSNEASCSITSSVITMTVNPILTPSVSISASKTTICPGENTTFNATPVNGGNNPSYIWKVDGTNSGTGNSFSSTNLTNGQSVTVELSSNATCASTAPVSSTPINITVKPDAPIKPGSITGPTDVCPGISSLSYSVAVVTNATSYEWSLPNGWSGTSTSNTISATSGATGSGTISVKAKNDCGTSTAETFAVTVLNGTPNTPGIITGDSQVCPVISKTYSITAVSGATDYEWTLPSGWNGSSTTNSIDITTGASGSGNISVRAKNSCGTSAAKTLAVTVKAGTPAVPVTISGTTNICPGTTNTYSIAAVVNATSYEWILPSGWTGTSTSTSINATSTSSGGNITVKAINDCGTSTEQTLAVAIKSGTPAAPVNLSGSNTVCPNTSETYTLTNDATATEYIWTLPNGWTGTSSTSSITVNTGTSGSGNITVKAKNDCGTSPAATIAVSVKAPAPVMSGIISGPATVCSGNTGLTYTIPAIANATSYQWSLPNGWNTPSLTTTTNSIIATAGSSGNITVVAINSCEDSSTSANFAVSATSGAPVTPGVITTNLTANAICPPATGITFNIPTIAGATNYIWTLPSGWEITSGAGTSAIVIRVNASAATTNNASVSVKAENICGQSANANISGIAVASHVAVNAGPDQLVCKISGAINIAGTYSFGSSNANLKPKWSSSGSGSFGSDSKETTTYLPSSADLSLGQVTLTLTTDAPSGACGPGKDELIITFRPDPTASISGTSTICTGNAPDITFTATPNTVVTYKKNGGTNQTIAVGANGTAILNTGALTANTTYSLVSVKNASAPDCPKTATGSAVVTITAKPTASISYGASPYNKCLTAGQPVTLSGTGAYTNGVYSAPAGLSINSTGEITPSNSTAGTYTVTYKTLASGGCEKVSTTTQVVIEDIPTITLSYSDTPFCSDNTSSPLPTLGGTGGYQGGSYSSDKSGLSIDASSGAINFAGSTPGSYNVTYSVTPAGGCSTVTQLTSVVITEKPQPSISYSAAEFCKSLSTTQSVSLTQIGTAVITGGTYSSLPSGLNINTTSGAINPSLSAVGDYTIKYTLAAANGCEAVFTETPVSITETPSAEISYAGPFCQSNTDLQNVTFINTIGAYEDGEFSGTAGLSINPSTGAITPSTSQSGEHTITYSFEASGGCESSDITTMVVITPAPDAIISYSGPFCTSESSPQAVTFTNTAGDYQNGIFSATNGLSIDADGNIDPSSSTSGEHIVTYKIEAAEGCEEIIITADVEIFDQVLITTQPINIGICSTQAASFEVIASGDNLSYQWKRTDGAAITNANGLNTAQLSFNNATSTNAGEYFVEVSGNAACPSIATSETVTLNVDEDIVIIKPAEDITICENDVTEITFEYIAHANGADLTFEWIKDNVAISEGAKYTIVRTGPTGTTGEYIGTITINNLVVSDNGDYAVKIKGPDSFTCSEATSKIFTLSINDQPEAPVITNVTYCQEDVASALTATGTNLRWYETETGDDLITGTPTPLTDAVGFTSYWVSQTPSECESPRAELVVEVKTKPAVPTTTETLSFCLNEVAAQLEAVGDSGNTINWYNAVDSTSPLNEAPTPVTSADVVTNFWVSQTQGTCESERVQITITINPLPIITAEASVATICSGSSTTLTATGATTYLWTIDGTAIEPATESTKSSLTVSPTATTTYLVTGTSDKGCKSTAEVTVNVDEQSLAGLIDAPERICISSGSATVVLESRTGVITKWEYKNSNTEDVWTATANVDLSDSRTFTGLNETTSYRVTVKNGVCDEVTSEATVIVDQIPVGGNMSWSNNERVYLTCEVQSNNLNEILKLEDQIGEIIEWEYRTASTLTWSTYTSQNSTLTSSDFASLLGSNVESTVFRAKIANGACNNGIYSRTAILSVIPSDIKPAPVEVSPDVLCYGTEISLSSSAGYGESFGQFEGGDFDNAGIKNQNWRFTNPSGGSNDFSTKASNGRADHWLRMVESGGDDGKVYTANIPNPSSGNTIPWASKTISEGNKGFALVTGNNDSFMETPPFSMGSLDEAILTFDQAYNLTAGATIIVEISTNGGSTYEKVLFSVTGDGTTKVGSSGNYTSFGDGTPLTRPKNKMVIDLGDYLGQTNLRVRFNYNGAIDGDVWAVDNIKVPEGPQDVLLQWFYDEDATDSDNTLEQIGIDNKEKVTFIPRKIGWNNFEVKTALLLDSNGDPCEDINNSETIRVFVFDQYTTDVIAETGECGNTRVTLSASTTGAFQGLISDYPTIDGYTGSWVITGTNDNFTLTNQDASSSLDPVNNPNAIFEGTELGDYSFSWKLTSDAVYPNDFYNESLRGQPVENTNCPPIININEVELPQCTTLDFDGDNDVAVMDNSFSGVKAIEAWIRPEVVGGTIISGPSFEINTPTGLTYNDRWYHLAVIFEGDDNGLYIDGIRIDNAPTGNGGGTRTSIGAKWTSADDEASNHFSGWIEEVRIWKNSPTLKEIRFMMNQRLKLDGIVSGSKVVNPLEGEIVPNKPIAGSYYSADGYNLDKDGDAFYNQTANDLFAYYRLISEVPDPDLGIITSTYKPVNGNTPDLSLNNIPGRLHNMTTHQENTSPTPYFSNDNKNGQNWETDDTWARITVWDPPNSDNIEWNIARINSDIQSGSKDIIMLGLLSETLDKKLNIEADHPIRISHYLLLDGNIDLIEESQLLQDQGSILAEASKGWLERDQQGKKMSFNYNYWSSPVSAQGSTPNNAAYLPGDVMSYNTGSVIEKLKFTADSNPYGADNTSINTCPYWLWKFHGTADNYDSWAFIGRTGTLKTGEGHTMKGTYYNGNLDYTNTQNYIYKGKPHNGDFTLRININENYLIGNPYPSALDANEFLMDNLDKNVVRGARNSQNVFNGALYFWDHFSGGTHILREYVGGYGVFNLIGGVRAASIDERIDNSNPNLTGGQPGDFIPVGQGFFVSTVVDVSSSQFPGTIQGDIVFKNSQRVFSRESSGNSVFLKPETVIKTGKDEAKSTTSRIRISLKSPKGYIRQLLVGANPNTTNGFDLGYDAPMIEYNVEDMFWLQGSNYLVIQGVPDFGKDQVLPIGVRIEKEGEFKIKIDELENMSDDHTIYLKDKVLDTIHDLRSGPYTSTSEPGEITDRFQLIFYKAQATPDPIVVEEPIIDDFSEISLLHSYSANEMMVLNPKELEISVIHLFDLNGKLIEIFDEVPSETEIRLKVSNYSEGIYILKMHTDEEIITRKIIIKK